MNDILALLGAAEPEPPKEPSPAPSEPATPPEEATPLFVGPSLPEESYVCPKCGKTYKAIFLSAPVNYNCTQCFYGSSRR